MPFGDQGTNFFCVVWKWVVVACYLAMLVASRPENSFKALGPAMVAAVLATVFAAAVVGFKDARRAEEQDLKLLEFEAISAETVMQDAERRCDTDALRGLALGAWTLRAEASALQRIFGDGAARGRTDSMDRSAAGLADGPARRRTDSAESWATADAADAPPPHASSHAMVPPGSGGRRGSHTLSHGLSSGGGNSSPGRRTSWPAAWHALQRPKSSFDAALYPCFVLPVSALAGMSALPQHEAALAAGVSKVWKSLRQLLKPRAEPNPSSSRRTGNPRRLPRRRTTIGVTSFYGSEACASTLRSRISSQKCGSGSTSPASRSSTPSSSAEPCSRWRITRSSARGSFLLLETPTRGDNSTEKTSQHTRAGAALRKASSSAAGAESSSWPAWRRRGSPRARGSRGREIYAFDITTTQTREASARCCTRRCF
mmetsp:Transcript_32367/g.111930  ORF Transcript_32367/g.111930 Transcript_32367/m.111930 type:complete len:429 (+) Transcript_32367:812-2098(+)